MNSVVFSRFWLLQLSLFVINFNWSIPELTCRKLLHVNISSMHNTCKVHLQDYFYNGVIKLGDFESFE